MVKINTPIRRQVVQILFWQLMIIMGLALVIALFQGTQKGSSTLVGGLAYWLPTFLFLFWVSSYAGAQAAVRFVVAFFAGEMMKLCVSSILFVVLFSYAPINLMYGMIGLASAVVAFAVVSVVSLYDRQEGKI